MVTILLRYLALFPDDPNVVFNESFLKDLQNCLRKIVPKVWNLERVLKVISVPKSANASTLRVIMDGDSGRALAFLERSGD